MKGILGRKVGMTETFTKEGKVIPVTIVIVEPNVVTQVKTKENDGYSAIQLGVFDKKEKNASKASIGHAKKAGTTPKRFLKEIRDVDATYNLGDQIGAEVFTPGEYVDVTGTSKGKGMQGVIKRHNQSRGPMAHGSRFHRRPGSMGTMLPMHVLKGKKLPGHMGNETKTIQNLEIIEVNVAENYLMISGNVPGPKKGLVLIKSAIKNIKPTTAKEPINYQTESVIDEVIEETVLEPIETIEVEVQEETSEVVENVEEINEPVVVEETTEDSNIEVSSEEEKETEGESK